MRLEPFTRPVDCTLVLTGSRALGWRSLVATALADGASRIANLRVDSVTAILVEALRSLGVPLRVDEAAHRIDLQGCRGYWPSTEAELDLTGAERVYQVVFVDGIPHFHAWLVPRRIGDEKGVPFLAKDIVCEQGEAEKLSTALRKILA